MITLSQIAKIKEDSAANTTANTAPAPDISNGIFSLYNLAKQQTSTPAADPDQPDANGNFLVDPGQASSGKQGASKLLGQLSRAQWNDWKSRFQPKIEELIAMAGDEGLPELQAIQAYETTGKSFDNAGKALTMQQKGLGVQLDATEQAAQDRRMGLAKAAASVDAANQARTSTKDLQQQIMAGGAGLDSLPSEILQQL